MSPFRLTFDLLNGHSNTINVLAFSSCRSYLASGREDKLLIIWRVSDSMLLYVLAFESPVTALVWHPNAPAILFCGCENGAVLRLKNFSAVALSQRSISFGVRGQVHCIDYDSHLRCLAVGMGQLILVSAETPTGNFLGSIQLSPSEDVLCAGDDDRLRPQSLHFYDNGNKIVAAYLNHGVIAWDLCTRTQLWRIEPILQSPQIASSALDGKCKLLAVRTMHAGVYVYRLGDSHHVGRCEPSPEEPNGVYPVAVSFLLQGGAIISGTSSGKVHVWEVGKKGVTQVLDQKGQHHLHLGIISFNGNESIVALGSSQKGDATYITIWRADTPQSYTHTCASH
ncbi:WD40-repeat-containing domain protein [Pisolithus tinctorius]|nr:WD40-repeat-containing domain protein [Pisolithus tinctorius]